ncbi:MAG: hypothetical protein V4819_20845 [Verrucomicrobiota bacterium]
MATSVLTQIWSLQAKLGGSTPTEVAQIRLDYYDGFATVDATNGSIVAMMLIMNAPSTKTFDFFSGGQSHADVFQFSYQPQAGTFDLRSIYANNGGGLVLTGAPWDIISGNPHGNPGEYDMLAPVDYAVLL